MQTSLTFFVHGKPAPGGSKTGRIIDLPGGGRTVAQRPASKFTEPWMVTVRGVASRAIERYGQPWDRSGPFYLRITYQLQRPIAHYRTGRNAKLLKDSAPKRHTQQPDRGKLDRALEDALTGFVYADDSQVYCIESEKVWVDRFEGHQGAVVTAYRIGDEE